MNQGKTEHVIARPKGTKLDTRHLLAAEPSAVIEAAAWLRRGYPVVFPTDTVYGVGVLPFDASALDSLYALKGRPADKGIPVLLADAADLFKVAEAIPPAAQRLIDRFWPGPLTLIVPRRAGLPDAISPNDNIAVRLPDHALARALIHEAGGAVATTSANLSGHDPALSGAAALAALRGAVAAVLDDGPTPGDRPSTIVDCSAARPFIVRPGPLSAVGLGLEENSHN